MIFPFSFGNKNILLFSMRFFYFLREITQKKIISLFSSRFFYFFSKNCANKNYIASFRCDFSTFVWKISSYSKQIFYFLSKNHSEKINCHFSMQFSQFHFKHCVEKNWFAIFLSIFASKNHFEIFWSNFLKFSWNIAFKKKLLSDFSIKFFSKNCRKKNHLGVFQCNFLPKNCVKKIDLPIFNEIFIFSLKKLLRKII